MPVDSPPPTLLIVDDDEAILTLVGRFAERAGFCVRTCAGGWEAIERLARERADVAVVDLRMPDVGGLDVLRAIREADPDCQVILMSGAGTIESAVEAVKLGAVDFLTKPFDFARLKALLGHVKEDASRRRRVLEAERKVARDLEFCGMIGRGPAMQELFGLIRRLAPHVRTALISGETGVGKELVARALYQLGPRRGRRFVTINCASIAESLFESELFGHVRGAFTGAVDSKPGLFETADGGTIVLDEVGEIPLAMQAKLLRVLESGEVQRVGAVEPRRVDVHVLAATNRDLRAEARAGRFRLDLFYRLGVVELWVPPLRERREDIPYLTAAFVRDAGERLGKRLAGPTPAAERQLVAAPWEGNVRELRNVIERACLLADGDFITEREIQSGAAPSTGTGTRGFDARGPAPEDGPAGDDHSLSSLEREHILTVLAQSGGNKMTAARRLGLSRRALYRRLERYGIRP
ncbi:MAG: sigma-54-dependent Fis family transcriptional regulator [Acidobacteria bacterium]|nr:sigma-54-dependent Fis family transcriptional regulator [Acidobacteriota bacterium]